MLGSQEATDMILQNLCQKGSATHISLGCMYYRHITCGLGILLLSGRRLDRWFDNEAEGLVIGDIVPYPVEKYDKLVSYT